MKPPKITQLKPPLLSAFMVNIRLLSETSELFLPSLEELGSKVDQVETKIEQGWKLNASITEREGEKNPALLVDIFLTVQVKQKDTDLQLGSYRNHSRAAFEIKGVIGELPEGEIPPDAVEPYLIAAADRVRTRCRTAFAAMNLAVQVGSPRGFLVQPPQAETGTSAKKARPTRKKRAKATA